MNPHSPQDVAEASARTMWGADSASRALGMQMRQIGPGYARVAMTVRSDMVNGWDVCHGGLIAALADSAFALACNSYGEVTVAAGFDVTFLESARLGDELVATAVVRSVRGRSGIYDVTVATVGTDESLTIAEFRGRSRSQGRRIVGADDPSDPPVSPAPTPGPARTSTHPSPT